MPVARQPTIHGADETHGKEWKGDGWREKLAFVDGNVAIRQNGRERPADGRTGRRRYTRNAGASGNVAKANIWGGGPGLIFRIAPDARLVRDVITPAAFSVACRPHRPQGSGQRHSAREGPEASSPKSCRPRRRKIPFGRRTRDVITIFF